MRRTIIHDDNDERNLKVRVRLVKIEKIIQISLQLLRAGKKANKKITTTYIDFLMTYIGQKTTKL